MSQLEFSQVLPDSTGSFFMEINATNAKGYSLSTLNINSINTPFSPQVALGPVLEISGRSARLSGNLVDAGGAMNLIRLHYGDSDGGTNPNDWNFTQDAGHFGQGIFDATLNGLESGKSYFYRFEANNSISGWSSSGSFTTKLFDQGTLWFNTGSNEVGADAGLFWDKGTGFVKIADPASIESFNFIAPNGTAWTQAKVIFDFPSGLFLGPNLDQVILEGVNALSLNVDGNVSIEKDLSGSIAFSNPYVSGGNIGDGHDSHFDDNPQRGIVLV